MITKQEVLDNLDEVKKYVSEIETKKEEKVVGLQIKNRFTGEVNFTSTKTTYKEACEDNKADLRGADLRWADLRGADLCGADLRWADLRGADLCGADLCGADLRGADLCGANLRGAELMNAKFTGKGGTTKIKKSGLDNFLKALGIVVED